MADIYVIKFILHTYIISSTIHMYYTLQCTHTHSPPHSLVHSHSLTVLYSYPCLPLPIGAIPGGWEEGRKLVADKYIAGGYPEIAEFLLA